MSHHQQMKPLQHVSGEPSIKVLTNQEHSMLRAQITNSALKVISQLQQSGFQSYLVGGGVRDLLLGNKPKDFDIATDATPEEVRKIFRNCRLIGRRFRLAHVFFGNEIIEVATFRGSPREGNSLATLKADSGILLRDNVYGSISEDANRRDFTINAMYYNATSCSIRDYTYGMEDLGKQLVRLIGDPEVRYREDPVRMLRAIRFSVKLRFDIEEKTAEPIRRLSCLLHHVPSARLYEEYLKMIQSGTGLETYHLMRKYGLFQELFPLIAYHFTSNHSSDVEKMLDKTFYLIDSRFREGRRPNIAFVFAAILFLS